MRTRDGEKTDVYRYPDTLDGWKRLAIQAQGSPLAPMIHRDHAPWCLLARVAPELVEKLVDRIIELEVELGRERETP